jgi:pimeloyl-ACP methyl ester carboxylesterase
MATFVLVHGASHGAWCWSKLTPLLQGAGHTVIAPDLPGHGADQTPVAMVTMDRYVDAVCGAMAKASGKSVLVGHSMGGAVISLVAESMPPAVDRLVYLTAFLPKTAETVGDLLNADPDSLLPDSFDLAEDNSCIKPKGDALAASVYNGCSAEDTQWAIGKLCAQAVATMFAPVELSEERFGSVPRYAVVCTQDRALSPGFQRRMYEESGCKAILELPTGHAPFLSNPAGLCELLGKVAAM